VQEQEPLLEPSSNTIAGSPAVDATRRRGGPPGRDALAHADQLASTLALDLRDGWQPTRAAYLDKVSKRHILAALVDLAEPLLDEARWLPERLGLPYITTVEAADVDSNVAAPGLAAAE
jgi:hypothetical protein